VVTGRGNHISYRCRPTSRQGIRAGGHAARAKSGIPVSRSRSCCRRSDESADGVGIQILSVFPRFVLQARSGTSLRSGGRVSPERRERTELVWTCFGYADDDDAMTEPAPAPGQYDRPNAGLHLGGKTARRPASIQRGIRGAADEESVVEMGGSDIIGGSPRQRAAVRGFWKAYRANGYVTGLGL